VAWPIDFSWLQSSHGTERTPIAHVFGHHQKYELMTKLFLCYQAVTALMKRFCQNAFAVETRWPSRTDGFGRSLGKRMDARATLQLDFDATKVRALIARYLGIDVEQLKDEVHVRNDFDLDSLNWLELLILIEETFCGVEFSDAAVDQIEVVGDLIRHVEITNRTSAA
jgi:acyl carrier protein